MSEILKLENNIEIIKPDKLKERKFLYNTIAEFRNGYWLREEFYPGQKFSLDVRWIQKGDYSIGKSSFELKENRGALSVSEMSFEIFNTKKAEKSGLALAHKDKVDTDDLMNLSLIEILVHVPSSNRLHKQGQNGPFLRTQLHSMGRFGSSPLG